MNILCILTGAHDDAGVLISGEKVYAIEMERLSRLKHNCRADLLTDAYRSCSIKERAFYKTNLDTCVHQTLEYLLTAGQISLDDIDVAVTPLQLRAKHPWKVTCGHHGHHAMTAYFPSGFSEAAILVIDIFGDPKPRDCLQRETISFWHGRDGAIEHLQTRYSPAYQFDQNLAATEHTSIGVFYTDLTILCGFGVLDGGKTMGLAPYGSDRLLEPLKQFVRIDPDTGHVTFRRGYVEFLERQERREEFQFRADIAFAAQNILEEVYVTNCQFLHRMTGTDCICLAGGVALNSAANGIITRRTPFKKIFIQPAAKDSGIALGVALDILRQHAPDLVQRLDYNNFCLGREYPSTNVEEAISRSNLPGVTRFEDRKSLCACAAELLARDKIVGWFQGRSEFGPRALGNRSILFNPANPKAKELLNHRVKFREAFRPFAPVVLEENMRDYFDIVRPSPYMLEVFPVVSPRKIPAVTHVDNSARTQTVNRVQNEMLWMLLSEFKSRTGLPVLLNTSLNIKGEPIAETPADAISSFQRSGMDNLVLGQYLLTKNPSEFS
jgi:carbamoyltransferase